MLGEQLFEFERKFKGRRVLDAEGPKIETSVVANGKIKDIDIIETVTYWTIPRASGVLYGEGLGVIMTKDGNGGETATYTAQGIGKFVGSGRISFRGSLFFNNLSSAKKLAFLNNLVAIFEDEVDEGGNTWAKAWEWR